MSLEVEKEITVTCGNGGIITLLEPVHHLATFGVTDDGWVYFDDLEFNAHDDLSIGLSGERTKGTLDHAVGDRVFSFHINAVTAGGKCDIRARGLPRNQWYRIQFDGITGDTAHGSAHGVTDQFGVVTFPDVRIPQ